MHLQDILDILELNRLVADKYISAVACPYAPYTLFNYTERATYEHIWVHETVICRGLVADTASGTILARPFDKFGNIDEPGFPQNAMTALIERPGPIEVTEKLDGSLIITWYDLFNKQWQCSTRGSFTSQQAQDAASWLKLHADTSQWDTARTYLCEWTAPHNRVVIRYERPELRLIGARTPQGGDAMLDELRDIGAAIGLPVVGGADVETLENLRETALSTIGVEGWVVRWADGLRVKVKTSEYMRLHRIISHFGPERVREMMLTDTLADYISSLPDEFQDEARSIAATITSEMTARIEALAASYQRLAPLLQESRKSYALAVQQEPPDDRPYLFSLADNKSITEKVIKAIVLQPSRLNAGPD